MNLLLTVAIGLFVWQGREELHKARIERRENLNPAIKPMATTHTTPAPKPDAAQPVKYADVATKDLFSKDRNPNVIIEPPKIEAPKPMPPLPLVYGVLGLPSGTKAIMSEKKGDSSRPVKTGDTIGEFKIVSLDTKNIVFDWDGKQISKNIDDLIDRSTQAAASAAPAVAAAAAAAGAKPAAPLGPGKAEPGGTDRPCVSGEKAPNGTVVDGYKISFVESPFGRINCHWSPVK